MIPFVLRRKQHKKTKDLTDEYDKCMETFREETGVSNSATQTCHVPLLLFWYVCYQSALFSFKLQVGQWNRYSRQQAAPPSPKKAKENM